MRNGMVVDRKQSRGLSAAHQLLPIAIIGATAMLLAGAMGSGVRSDVVGEQTQIVTTDSPATEVIHSPGRAF